MTPPLQQTIRDGAEQFLRLTALAADAQAVQWDRSHAPKPRVDSDRKSSGGYSNPTLEITLDDRRLGLREAVERANKAIHELSARAAEVRADLERAVNRWEGTD